MPMDPMANPIVLQRADPCVLRHDGQYYFTGSHPLYDRIVLRRAERLADLQAAPEVTIWSKHAEGPQSNLIWAPELHRIGDAWYVYYAAAPNPDVTFDVPDADDTFNHRVYCLECLDADPLTGTWTEKGQVDTGWESFALDATSFVLRGDQYLVWAQQDFAVKGHSNLYIARMENPWTLATPAVMLCRPELDWEIIGFWVAEGPSVLQRDGRLFLTYSASATGIDYAMGLLTASADADLLDPRAGPSLPSRSSPAPPRTASTVRATTASRSRPRGRRCSSITPAATRSSSATPCGTQPARLRAGPALRGRRAPMGGPAAAEPSGALRRRGACVRRDDPMSERSGQATVAPATGPRFVDSIKRLVLWNYGGIYFFYFVAWQFIFTFMGLWLDEEGMSSTSIGRVSTVMALTALCLQPLYGFLQDRLGFRKPLFAFVVVCAAMIGPFFQFVFKPLIDVNQDLAALVGGMYLSLVTYAGVSVVEAYNERASRANEFEYGHARLFGALGGSFASAIGGLVWTTNPDNIWWAASFSALVLGVLLFVARVPRRAADAARPGASRGRTRSARRTSSGCSRTATSSASWSS